MCSVLTSLVFHKKDKAFAIYSGEFFAIYSGEFSLISDETHTCSVLTSLVYLSFTRKIKRLRSIQVSFAALLFSLIAFSDFFRWLLFEEAFIKVTKLSVSILEADSVHLFHLQLCVFHKPKESVWIALDVLYTFY